MYLGFTRMYNWWSLCTLDLLGCTSGGVYVPWIYSDVPLVGFMYLGFTRMYLWWGLCTVHLLGCTSGGVYVPWIYSYVPLVEFMCLVFTRMYLWWSLCAVYLLVCTSSGVYVPCTPGERYRRLLRILLLCLCDVFRALINSLVCWEAGP